MTNNLQKTLCNGMMYGLKVDFKIKEDSYFRLDGMFDEREGTTFASGSMVDWIHEFDFVKPYLFPLSDLTKEIEFRGERFVPIVEICKIEMSVGYWDGKDYEVVSESEITFMISKTRFYFKFTTYPRLGITEPNGRYKTVVSTKCYEIIDQLRAWMFNADGLEEDQYIRVTDDNNPYK